MATEAACKLWFPAAARAARPAAPSLRILCFHNAGSAESTYTAPNVARGKRTPNELIAWAESHGAEVLAVQLPGREGRREEPALRSCAAVAAALLPVVEPLVRDTPYVVVGHSVGTWNSYELLSLLRSRNLPMPLRVFYSCFPPPTIPLNERPWTPNAQLPTDGAFQQECRGWDVNEVVFSPAMWAMYKELMRADFCCFDEYTHTRSSEPPLAVPMTTFYATRDRKITAAMVEGWSSVAASDGSFESIGIEGHHLFHYDPPAKKIWFGHIVKRLDGCLRAALAPAPAPAAASVAAPALSVSSSSPHAIRWAFNIREWNPSPEEWELATSLLPGEDAARVERFKFDKDRKLAMGSRLLQRAAVSTLFALRWREVSIGRTREGKPYLANSPLPADVAALPNWNFNVTHHGGIVAIATEPCALVGLDVMDSLERPGGARSAEDFFTSFTDNFTPYEWTTIRSGAGDAGKLAQFYRHWSMKEAYIKAVGIGLGFELRRAEFRYVEGSDQTMATVSIDGRHRPEWSFKLSALPEAHVACTACGPAAEACDTYRATLPAYAAGGQGGAGLSTESAFGGEGFEMKRFEDLLACADTPMSGGSTQPAPAPAPAPAPVPEPEPEPPAAAAAAARESRASSLESREAKVTTMATMMESDPFIEFPSWAADEWSMEDIQAFFDSCGQWEPPRK